MTLTGFAFRYRPTGAAPTIRRYLSRGQTCAAGPSEDFSPARERQLVLAAAAGDARACASSVREELGSSDEGIVFIDESEETPDGRVGCS
jgi:hypothetical protein